MNTSRVLIVEDQILIALDLEAALLEAGFEICGIAASQPEALRIAAATGPSFAVVDVQLSPGDGRIVGRELARRYGTAVLMATSCNREIEILVATGALTCLPKPFDSRDVPAALRRIAALRDGRRGPGPRLLPHTSGAGQLDPLSA